MTNWTRRLLRGTEVDFSFARLVSAHICRSDDDVGDDKDDDDDWWWFLVLFACVYLDWSSPWSYLSWTTSSLHLSSSPIRTWFSRWRPRSSVILTHVPHAILDTRYTMPMPMRAQRRYCKCWWPVDNTTCLLLLSSQDWCEGEMRPLLENASKRNDREAVKRCFSEIKRLFDHKTPRASSSSSQSVGSDSGAFRRRFAQVWCAWVGGGEGGREWGGGGGRGGL